MKKLKITESEIRKMVQSVIKEEEGKYYFSEDTLSAFMDIVSGIREMTFDLRTIEESDGDVLIEGETEARIYIIENIEKLDSVADGIQFLIDFGTEGRLGPKDI